MPLKDRLWFRVLALFLMAFLALFMLLFVWDLFVAIGESAELESNPAAQAPPVVIDPKIETELQKVLAFDTVSDNVVAISDPFVDRSGLSSTVGAAGTVQQASVSTTTGSAGTAATASASTSPGGVTRTVSGTVASNASNQVVPTTKDRYQIWEERVNAGYDAGPVSTAFAVEDLVPVGYVSGGSGAEEVMFFSASLCRTFSFPIGTRFFDGWLGSLSQQEVVFTLDANSRVIRKSFTAPRPCSGSAGAAQ
jgi:hypothetical protein